MLIRPSCLKRLLLWIPCLAILAYTIIAFQGLSADDTLLRSLFSPLDTPSPKQGNSSQPKREFIPRIIHQTYKSSIIPDVWRASYNACRVHNPSGRWTHILWTDDTSREFIHEFYPSFLPTYDVYSYDIQRVDAFRYFVLYHYGGIYLDLDVGCTRDLSPLLTQHAFFAKTEPLGVSNDVMGVERGHPLFGRLVASLTENNYRRGTKYPTVMMSTGPMFVTRLLLDFLKQPGRDEAAGGHGRRSRDESMVTILPPALYDSSPGSYFRHYPGSTWHGWDARMVVAISRSPVLFSLCVFLLCFMWIRCTRRVPRGHFASERAG